LDRCRRSEDHHWLGRDDLIETRLTEFVDPAVHTQPIPAEYRVRADWAAVLAGLVAFLFATFVLSGPEKAPPSSILVLAFLTALSAGTGFVGAWNSVPGPVRPQELTCLVRCGARAGALGALIGAGMIVMAARLFASPITAIALLVPCALSILPSSFAGVIAAAIAAGVRLPALPPVQRPDSAPTGRGFIAFATLASAAGFLSIFIPSSQSVSSNTDLPPEQPGVVQTGPAAWSSPQPATATPDTRTPADTIDENGEYEKDVGRWSPYITPTPTVPPQFRFLETPSPNFPRRLQSNEEEYQKLYAFIANHHDKINRGDLGGLTLDYDDYCYYFQHGSVGRTYIHRAETASRSKYWQYHEVIAQPVEIEEIEPHRYEAHYKIFYDGIKRNHQQIRGVSDVYLFVKPYSHGFLIIRQQNHP
jgi:hypothetical protein